jgi:hypothetical protein
MGWIKDRIDDLLFPFKRKKNNSTNDRWIKKEIRNKPYKKNDEDS